MFRRTFAAACLALVGFAALANNASASYVGARFGSFVIHNLSSTAINYTVVWGDGEVESFTIEAGARRAHFTQLDENGNIPTPTIVFDSVGGDRYFQAESYELDAYAVSNPMAGKDYSFVYSANGVNIDLYEGQSCKG